MNKEFLLKRFKQALDNGEYNNVIGKPYGVIEIEYCPNDEDKCYGFDLGFEVTSMPLYKQYSGTWNEPAYDVCVRETRWGFTGEGAVYVDGDRICDISDIFSFTPQNQNMLKNYFEVNDAYLVDYEHENGLNESVRKIIAEEIDKKEVKDMINKAVDDLLSDTKFRKKIVSITADVLEDFMDSLWTRKPFWKSIIKRS